VVTPPVPAPHVDAAGFVVPAGEAEPRLTQAGRPDRALRCASVLKPLLFWAAAGLPPLRDDPESWAVLAKPAVTVSANDPTVAIWQEPGPDALLDRLGALGGTRWGTDPAATPTFGKVMVRAAEVARGYAALAVAARSADPVAEQLLGWMRDVPEEQTFGARAEAAAALGVDPATVATKCGWFGDDDETVLRTHAVTVCLLPGGSVRGTAVLTAVPFDAAARAVYAAAYQDGPEVLPMHAARAGRLIAEATAALLRPPG
jgi:hypothetical protein